MITSAEQKSMEEGYILLRNIEEELQFDVVRDIGIKLKKILDLLNEYIMRLMVGDTEGAREIAKAIGSLFASLGNVMGIAANLKI